MSFVKRFMYIVLIWESPLSEVTLSLHYLTLQVCVLEHPKVQRSEEERGKDSEEGVDSGLLPEEAEAANELVRHVWDSHSVYSGTCVLWTPWGPPTVCDHSALLVFQVHNTNIVITLNIYCGTCIMWTPWGTTKCPHFPGLPQYVIPMCMRIWDQNRMASLYRSPYFELNSSFTVCVCVHLVLCL